jgi:hypothetical protein
MEIDSLPGGIGLTSFLNESYAKEGFDVIGGAEGILEGLSGILKGESTAFLVPLEGEAYRKEFSYLSARLNDKGFDTRTLNPNELQLTDEGLVAKKKKIERIYRYFELFDFSEIASIDAILYATVGKKVSMTPPMKFHLEEKLLLSFLHNPFLESFWKKEIGIDAFQRLTKLVPPTWVLDPGEGSFQSPIHGLKIKGQPIHRFHALKNLGVKEREYVIKPSGFSEIAWGSRGVKIGHDLSVKEWNDVLDKALESFTTLPYVMQPFEKAKKHPVSVYLPKEGKLIDTYGRALIRPYYFCQGEDVRLCGVKAVVCPLNKKILHGMKDSVIAPCSVFSS